MRLVHSNRLRRQLAEAVKLSGYYAEQYEQFFDVDNPAIKKLLDENSDYDIVAMAKDGDAVARKALNAIAERIAVSKYYKEPCSFLGPNPPVWRKKSAEDLERYFNLVDEAIDKALNAIDLKKLHTDSAANGFSYYVRGYIMRLNQQYHDASDDERAAYSLDDDSRSQDHNEDLSVSDSTANTDLKLSLKDLKNDKEWHGGKYDIGAIFKDFMISGDIDATAEKFDVAKNTIRYKVFPKIVELFDKYGIDKAELATAYHSNPSIIASL